MSCKMMTYHTTQQPGSSGSPFSLPSPSLATASCSVDDDKSLMHVEFIRCGGEWWNNMSVWLVSSYFQHHHHHHDQDPYISAGSSSSLVNSPASLTTRECKQGGEEAFCERWGVYCTPVFSSVWTYVAGEYVGS